MTDTIDDNRADGLHTVVYLDIKVGYDPTSSQTANRPEDTVGYDRADGDQYMTADVGRPCSPRSTPNSWGRRRTRRQSRPLVDAATMTELAERSFGDPLHLLVIPGECHLLEADALVELAGVDREALDIV